MLETTFCPNCGKPYDVSLGECPVCARRRAAEEAKRNAQAKARKGAKKNKKGKPQKPKPVLPAREVDEPTVPMDTEAIRRAEEEARVMAGQRAQQNVSAEQTAPVQPEPAATEEVEPETGEEGINKKLLIAVIGAALVLVLIVVGIGRTLSSNTAFRHGQDNPTTAATSVEEKEEEPKEEEPAEEEPAEEPKKEEPEEKPEEKPAEEEPEQEPEEKPAEEEPTEEPAEEEPEEESQETPQEKSAEEEPQEQPAEPEKQEPAEEKQEETDTEETAAREMGAESASV